MNFLKNAFATESQGHGDTRYCKLGETKGAFDFPFKVASHFKHFSVIFSVAQCLCGTTALFGGFLVPIDALAGPADPAAAWKCAPTPQDEIGPFYRPNAPLRSEIGRGYVLEGTVRSAATCQPIPGARIEFWQAGPDGKYSDAYRATIISDRRGRYRLTTSFPPPYARRPSHIHILVDMRGYAGLITQHYPGGGKRQATFDLTLETE